MPRRFKITDAHMKAFSEQQRTRFEEEMAVYLSKEYPQETKPLGDDGLSELIGDGVDKAKTYNIILERDVARYIEFMVILAPDFDDSPETPWAKDILTNESWTPELKIGAINEMTRTDE